MSPQIASTYGDKPMGEMTASKIAEVNVEKREYQKEYLEYWNSTEQLSGTGRPVDAVILPLAPFAAARPTKYNYYGYSTIINVLDYTSCTIPVTNADKSVDILGKGFEPMSDHDRKVMDACE